MKVPQPSDSDAERQLGRDPVKTLQAGLYVVATPIGHARDITLRALDVLGACDAILAEDTRNTGKLLAMHGLKKPMIALHDHNEGQMLEALQRRVAGGDALALVSDAGTPLVSDPGFKIVRGFIAAGLPVTPLPGPSSVLAALVVSGLPPDRFFFGGFVPAKSGERRSFLATLSAIPATSIVFETGPRLADSLADMAQAFGPRPAAVVRELTKLFEEAKRGTLAELAQTAQHAPAPKGEIVVVIGPPPAAAAPSEDTIDAALRAALLTQGVGSAASEVSLALGLSRRSVYERALALTGRKGP